MNAILDNLRALSPFLILSWTLVLLFTIRRPQRFANSLLLMIACFCTMLFISGLFGTYMNYALMAFFLLTMGLLFMVPVLLTVNGVQLIRREGLSPAHLLSLILGLIIGAGEIATVIFVLSTYGSGTGGRIHFPALLLAMSVFYVSCLILNFVLYSVFIQILPHRRRFDYIIIHGCALAGGDRMTKLLSNRLDKAIEIYQHCRRKPVLIASGGQGRDESLSEAAAMKAYLLEKGIPEEHILAEDRSATTRENLSCSKALIEKRGGGRRIALISSNYHIYRCLSYAREAGLRCVGIGAPVAFYYWPSALLREFIAVFRTKRFMLLSLIGYFLFLLPILALYLL